MEPFSEYHSEPLDYVGVGDSVVVPTRQWGIGRASGASVEMEVTFVFEFRDHMITRVDEYDTLKRPSKPWGFRSKTLTPTPEPAGYCGGDVAGEGGTALPNA